MRTVITSIIAFILGAAVGIFGVMVSVFADAGMRERLIFIAMVLPVYALLGFLLCYLGRVRPLWPGIALLSTGFIVLIVFLIREFAFYMLPYLLVLPLITMAGAFAGYALALRRNRRFGKTGSRRTKGG